MWEWIGRYWIEAAFGVLTAALGFGYRYLGKRLKQQRDEQEALRNGIKALLRDRIIQAYNHYIERGYCPIYGLENIHAMYKEYKALGGNGAISELIEKIERLPTQQPAKP